MLRRISLLVSVLALGVSALLGVTYSGATWTATIHQPMSVAAANDWTPPSVTQPSVAGAVQGTAATVSATASDDRSAIAFLVLQVAPSGTDSWSELTGCTDQGAGTSSVTRTCTWDTTATADGDYQVRAIGTDAAGYTTTSSPAATSVVNHGAAVLTPLPAAVSGTRTVTGALYNAGNNGTNIYLEYRPSGTSSWTQLDNSCSGSGTSISCTWTTTALADGGYDVQLRSNKTDPDVQYGVVVDNTSPTASISVPGGTLAGSVDLGSTAVDPLGQGATVASGVASVEFQYRPTAGTGAWSSCGSDATAPYSCTLNTAQLDNTSYDFRSVVTDAAGNSAVSTAVTRAVDNSPATVSVTNPLEGAVVDGTVNVTADAQSPRGVTSVRFEYRLATASSWTACGTDTTAPYSCSWATNPLPGGRYLVRAVLSQTTGGDVVSDGRTVTVDHSVGTVAITSPTAGSTLSQKTSVTVSGTTQTPPGVTSVTLRATPTNPTGPVVSVPCTLSSGVFACTWGTSGIVWGEYDLRADMLQGNGVTVSTPNPTHVTVDNVNATITLGLAPAPSSGYVSGTETLTATTSSNIGVTSVGYQYSVAGAGTWTSICSGLTTAPYSCSAVTTQLPNGSYDVRAVMTLANGQTRTSAVTTVTVANLAGYDVQGTTQTPNGSADANDTLVFTYSTLVKPGSVVPGWNGVNPQTLSVSLADVGNGASTSVTVGGSNLGQVSLSEHYVSNNGTVVFGNASLSMSTVQGRSVVTLKLGSPTRSGNKLKTDSANGTITWTPSASVLQLYTGSPCATALVTESGAADKDF